MPASTGIDWRKFILIKGKPGTGKTHATKVVIQESLDEEYTVCCATPTGILTSTYRQRPAVNWELGRFALLIVDELSMVPVKIFDHIASTLRQLHVRPIVLLCGDQQQQQPIETVSGKTMQTKGILNHDPFYSNCVVVDFLEQQPCTDPKFQEYLNHLRYFRPSKKFL